MTEAELKAAVGSKVLFAKCDPQDKAAVVLALKAAGVRVGMMGDGINDALALRKADVGITVKGATDVARDVADIVMSCNDLNVLREGIIAGRVVFLNQLKYIKMTVSSSFGNVLSVLCALALPFQPMLPCQLLLQNLMYDMSMLLIPTDNVDADATSRPRQWDPDGIINFMLWIGPVSSVFDIATYVLMFFFFNSREADSHGGNVLFNSGWFVEGLLTQTLVVHVLRTRHLPFLESCASRPLLISTVRFSSDQTLVRPNSSHELAG